MHKEISTEDRSFAEVMKKMKKSIIEAALYFLREEKFLNLNVFCDFTQPRYKTNLWIVFYYHDILFVRSEIAKVQARFHNVGNTSSDNSSTLLRPNAKLNEGLQQD